MTIIDLLFANQVSAAARSLHASANGRLPAATNFPNFQCWHVLFTAPEWRMRAIHAPILSSLPTATASPSSRHMSDMMRATSFLAQQAKPDRLIIEPSGLGHPAGVSSAHTYVSRCSPAFASDCEHAMYCTAATVCTTLTPALKQLRTHVMPQNSSLYVVHDAQHAASMGTCDHSPKLQPLQACWTLLLSCLKC